MSRYDVEDQQFVSLSCKITKEVVSLDLTAERRAQMISAGPGEHLSPEEFHSVIEEHSKGNANEANVVLVDVRNIYETEIGRFEGGHVPVLDPMTRKVTLKCNTVQRIHHIL